MIPMTAQRSARSAPYVLIVDADPARREALSRVAAAEGWQPVVVASADDARSALARLRRTEAETANGDTIEIPIGTSLEDAGRELILATLQHAGGVRKRAAEMLGISLKTLYNRLVAYRANGQLPGAVPSRTSAQASGEQ